MGRKGRALLSNDEIISSVYRVGNAGADSPKIRRPRNIYCMSGSLKFREENSNGELLHVLKLHRTWTVSQP